MGNSIVVSKDATIHVGKQPKQLSTVAHRVVKFHDFERLFWQNDWSPFIDDASFECHGYVWTLGLRTFSQTNPANVHEEESWISVALSSRRCTKHVDRRPLVKYKISCNGTKTRGIHRIGYFRGRECKYFMKLEDVISDKLDQDGTLALHVEIQVYSGSTYSLEGWRPTQQVVSRQLRALEMEQDTDVTFRVGGQLVKAHRLILSWHAPVLASLVEDVSSQDQIVEIPKVTDPDHFRSVLRFIYSEDDHIVTSWKALGECRELLVTANLLGIVKLKVLLEDAIVVNYLNDDTVIDLFLFADAHNCSLLYEASLCTIVEGLETFMKKGSEWIKVKESSKLLNAIMEQKHLGTDTGKSFGTLYAALESAGKLDQDGPRALLGKRLKEDD